MPDDPQKRAEWYAYWSNYYTLGERHQRSMTWSCLAIIAVVIVGALLGFLLGAL